MIHFAFAQSPTQLTEQAAKHLERMEYQQAVKLYEQAIQQAPRNIAYHYGAALAHYRQRNYPKAISYGEQVLRLGGYEVDYYRLLANSYDLSGDYEKGIAILRQATKVHPYEGALYFDMGIIAMERQKMEEAVFFWEEGIKAQPPNADNYYMATLNYAQSNQILWSLIYGELFLNLERGTDRFNEISQLLYDLYAKIIQNGSLNIPAQWQMHSFQPSIFDQGHQQTMAFLLSNNKDTYISSGYVNGDLDMVKVISDFRHSFNQVWRTDLGQRYPTTFYQFHETLLEKGYYEAYHYWLFAPAAKEPFANWFKNAQNQQTYQAFINWYLSNPMKIDFEDFVVRTAF